MLKYSIKNILFAFLMGFTFLLCSCSDWLNVSPKSEMKDEDMFKNESGFRDAIVGVYSLMTNRSLYGANLSYGFLDVLAQYYSSPRSQVSGSPHSFNNAALFKYTESSEESRLSTIWSLSYKAIVNINMALSHIDDKKDVFTSTDVYNIYKGELLALRAFIHFDILRLYAPSLKMESSDGGNALAIPYLKMYTNLAQPQLTINQTIQCIVEDLNEAKLLLHGSDTYGPNRNPDNLNKEQFKNRHYRFNYYAVTGILARVHLYAGNKSQALLEATEIIGDPSSDPKLFTLATTAAQEEKALFGTEIMFALNIQTLDKDSEGILNEKSLSSTMLTMNSTAQKAFFDTSAGNNDFRQTWITPNTAGNAYFLSKYKKEKFIPVMRLSELYLIAAECSEQQTGIAYLNRIRSHRGNGPINVNANLNVEIYKEFRREIIGDGQLFFFYKRNIYGKIGAADNITISDYNATYNLPVPKSEIEYGNIK